MSTHTTLSKIATSIVFISGAYLFFITIVLAPYINFTLLTHSYAITKVLILTSGAVVGLLQLFFLLPSISKRTLATVPRKIKFVSGLVFFAGILSVILSASQKTSIFGMFSTWDSNVIVYTMYSILFLAWLTYFLTLRLYSLDKNVFHTMMVLAVIVAIAYSLGEYFIWKPSTGYTFQNTPRISLGFRNPLFAAYFLGMLWSYISAQTVKLFTHGFSNQVQRFAAFGSFLLFIGTTLSLLLTYTRSAWLAAFVSLCVLVLQQVLSQKKNHSSLLRLFLTLGILMLSVFTLGYTFRQQITNRNTDLTYDAQNTLSTIAQSLGKSATPEAALDFYQQQSHYSSSKIRLLEWIWGLRTWTGSVKNFLVGVGPDAGFFEMPKYRDAIFNNFATDAATKPFYVRSLFINGLMQFGVIVFLGTCYLAFQLALYLYRKVPHELPAFLLTFSYFAQGIFYYPSHIATALFFFALAYLVAQSWGESTTFIRLSNAAEKVLALLLVTLLCMWAIPLAKATYQITVYTALGIPAPITEMEKNAKLAINNNVMKRYLVYHYSSSPQANALLPQLANSNDIDDLRIAGEAYYLRARKNNSEADTLLSISALRKQLAIDATLPATWDSLGLRYLYIGEFDDSKEAFTKAISLKPDYWYSYLHLGELSRQQCNPTEAVEWYKKAKDYVPSAETEISEAEAEIKTPRDECK